MTARLVELDPRIAALAERSAQSKGLRRVEVAVGDAGLTRHYCGMVPAGLVPQICRWFEERGFERQWLSEPQESWGVGVHRFTGKPEPLEAGRRMFAFV